jgi:4-amino-4-deoxy-L-arabinose transferase-like glycosyltransferase
MSFETSMQTSAAAPSFWQSFFLPGQRLLSKVRRLDDTAWPLLWIIGLFAVQAVPATIIRASNLEEGRIVAMARGAAEDGHWITPFIYGQRFAERPVLLSWLSALFGQATGGVTLWSLRIPHLGFFLAGALLIYALLRSCTGKAAAIFGAFCWMTMPLVAPKFINAEADIVLSTLLFTAFCLWWRGHSQSNMTVTSWTAIACLLTLAGLTKGPQPIAYFSLGVGAYLLLKAPRQLLTFCAANIAAGALIACWYVAVREQGDAHHWMAHSRLTAAADLNWLHDHLDLLKSLIIETLPAVILLVPAVIVAWRRRRVREPDLLLACLLYSSMCTLALIVWPGGVSARYAMPATMTLAVICGLMFESRREHQARATVAALVVSYLIFGGLLIRGWIAMPFWPQLFQESRIAGTTIANALQGQPDGRLHVVATTTEHNMLVYVRGPIRAVSFDDLARLDMPATAVLLPNETQRLAREHPDLRIQSLAPITAQRTPYEVVRLSR